MKPFYDKTYSKIRLAIGLFLVSVIDVCVAIGLIISNVVGTAISVDVGIAVAIAVGTDVGSAV